MGSWHADIKPDNILIVKGKFKLADPGFARFEKKSSRDSTIIPGGTTTYGIDLFHIWGEDA
jgi:serine/threonine protein kinase